MNENKTLTKVFKTNINRIKKVQISLTDEDILQITAANPNTQEEILDALSKNSSESIRAAVASNCSTFPELLENLSKDRSVKVKGNVAANTNTFTKTLEKLSKDRNISVIRNVAANTNASRKCCQLLSKQKDIFILICVVKNSACPSSILQEFFEKSSMSTYNKHDAVRLQSAIACNSNIKVNLLEQLSKSKDFCTRLNVINNTNCSVAILKKLSKDLTPLVAVSAQRKLKSDK